MSPPYNAKDIQRALAGLGLYAGRLDGDIGPKSKAAIRAFQRINRLRPDGVAGPRTLAKLFPEPIEGRDTDPALSPIDTGARMQFPRQRDVERHYGPVGKNQTRLALPFPMKLAWNKRVTVQRITVHEKVHDSAARVFGRIASAYSPAEIQKHGFNLFGGSLNVRKMRGGSRWSMHSWGIAIDFDPIRNQLRWRSDRAYLAKPECKIFWQLWEEEGWLGLGRARNYDWMHIQAARL